MRPKVSQWFSWLTGDFDFNFPIPRPVLTTIPHMSLPKHKNNPSLPPRLLHPTRSHKLFSNRLYWAINCYPSTSWSHFCYLSRWQTAGNTTSTVHPENLMLGPPSPTSIDGKRQKKTEIVNVLWLISLGWLDKGIEPRQCSRYFLVIYCLCIKNLPIFFC